MKSNPTTPPTRHKEVIRLRERTLKNGNKSLYLDIYWKGVREYEFLNLYTCPASNTLERQRNRETMLLAEQIKAHRLLDLQADKHHIRKSQRQQSFIKYFELKTRQRYNSLGNYGNWKSTYQHLLGFCKHKDVSFLEVDETFLNNFKRYLLEEARASSNKRLAQNSAHSYFNKVKAALREAHEEKIIPENVATRVRGIRSGETKREFLSWEEVERIAKEPCDLPLLKTAFLFSVLTGLRWGDIIKMTWAEIRGSEAEGWFIRFQQRKTKSFEVLPITPEARDLLGPAGKMEEQIFGRLIYSAHTSLLIGKWMLRAGIHRKITFYCARHTHATLLLSQGVDIYVISKLLGHKMIKTTEIYTKVTNMKKVEAIGKMPKLELPALS